MGMRLERVQGYAAKAAAQRLEPFDYDPAKLGEHDVRVSVTHCGVCYSDIQAIDDYYRITTYPFVPGHEIVGHVTEIGPAAIGLKIGDRVGIGWQARSCMRCEWCLKGEEHLCMDVDNNGVWFPHGGFSTSVTVDSRFAYPLPDAMPPQDAAVLMCAGVTVFSPLRTFSAGPSSKVGVMGVGGLGHLAIQFAHALGCEVTVFSSSPGKRKEALGFGADDFILAGDKASMKERDLNLDLLLYTSHARTDWTYLFENNIIRRNGRIVMMGFSSVPVEFRPTDLVVYQLSITGSFIGSRRVMREMLSFAQAKGIKPKVELMPMAQVNEAIQKVRENNARYRVVLTKE
jgi:uncharacterized zinc-type alcohol dehydrogenase-like protein